MKKTLGKWKVMVALALAVVTPMTSLAALPPTVFQKTEGRMLSSGTYYEHQERFTPQGWISVHVLRMDLQNPTQTPVALYGPQGIGKRATVKAMADQDARVVGAVNGDYFNYSPMPSTLGVMVSEGQMLSSPPHMDYALPAFFLDAAKNGAVGYLNREISFTNGRTGANTPINMINKISADYTTVALLDQHWGATSPGTAAGVSGVREVVVENGQVTAIRDGQAGVAIPANGYVLAAKIEKLPNIQVGDQLNVNRQILANSAIPFAMGGGSIIVKDGEVTLTNIHSEGIHPRTGIGVTADHRLLLVAVDGRSKTYKGLAQKDFGELMKSLGAVQALNLDGGGSTTMVVKDGDVNQVVNKPSDGSPRPVVNGVGIRSEDPQGSLSYLKIIPSQVGVHQGSRMGLSVQGYDQYHRPLGAPQNVTYQVTGVEGVVENGQFYPKSTGTATITASAGAAKGSVTVPVYGPIAALRVTDGLTLAPGASKDIVVTAVDSRGFSAPVPGDLIAMEAVGGIGEMQGHSLKAAANPAQGYVQVTHGAIRAYVPVRVGSQETSLVNFETLEGMSAKAWPTTATASLSAAPEAHQGESAVAIDYDFTQADGPKAAYVILPQNVGIIPEKADEVVVAVKADGQGGGLKADVVDANGKTYTLVFAPNIRQTRWQTLEAALPQGVAYPARVASLYVAQPDGAKKITGRMLLDTLITRSQGSVSRDGVPDNTPLIDPAAQPVDAAGANLVIKRTADGLFAGDKGTGNYSKQVVGGATVYTLKTNKGIMAGNQDQWGTLLQSLKVIETPAVVLVMKDGPETFQDQKEAGLLNDTLKDLAWSGKQVFLVAGSGQGQWLAEGVHQLRLGQNAVVYMSVFQEGAPRFQVVTP